ncbi:hypothetical protein D7231_35235, partial [Streptomyces klenkii]
MYDQSRGVCLACRVYRKRHPDRGACRICRHTAALWEGACRLCRRQAALAERNRGGKERMDLEGDNRHGQQLYFGDMDRRVRLTEPIEARRSRRKGRPAPRDRFRALRPASHKQLVLFQSPRSLRTGQQRGFPPPLDTELAAALDAHATEYAQRHGWSKHLTWAVRRALRILLGTQDTPGAAIKATAVAQVPAVNLPARHLRALLAETGFLDDDRPRTLELWFTAETEHLPPAMADELRIWFTAIHRGSNTPPRSRPLGEPSVRHYLRNVLPMVRRWAASNDSLRAITRADILDTLPAGVWRRRDAITAVRSLFRTLKRHRAVFHNPTTRIPHEPTTILPQPVDTDAIRQALEDDDPVRATLAAMVAFHALTVTDL